MVESVCRSYEARMSLAQLITREFDLCRMMGCSLVFILLDCDAPLYLSVCVQVATALGDLQLAGKCRINVAYNYIWLGQYAKAQRIILAQVGQSQHVGLQRYFKVRVQDVEANALT